MPMVPLSWGVRPGAGSRLALDSPMRAASSSPYALRDNGEDGDETSEEGHEVVFSQNITTRDRSGSIGTGLTRSSSTASSVSSSRNSHSNLLDNFLPSETVPFATPQNYRNVKPLQAAFMSTGLISKRVRALDSPSLASPFTAAPILGPNAPSELVNAISNLNKHGEMPDTPCKRPLLSLEKVSRPIVVEPEVNVAFPPVNVDSEEKSPQKSPMDYFPLAGESLSPSSIRSQSGSGSDVSPTTENAKLTNKFGLTLRRIGAPLFRRRSSGQLNNEAGVFSAVDRSGGSIRSRSPGKDEMEPMTPTRTLKENSEGTLLLTV